MNILQRCRGGYPLFTYTKKIQRDCSEFLVRGGDPFAGGGAPISDEVSEGVPKFYGDSEGGGYIF